MDAQDDSKLETLIARDEIRQAMARFCRGIDRIDDDLACSIWAPQARTSYEGFFEGTGEGLCLKAGETHRRHFLAHAHQLANSVIEVAGDRAVSETYVTASVLSETDGRHMLKTVQGRYLDRWARRDGRWMLEHRKFVRTFTYDQPVEANVGGALRSPEDPSYELFRALAAA